MADSGNSSQRNGGDGGQNRPGTGGPASGPFTWNGGSTASTFDPKNFGTKLFGDLNTAYGQGPKINPVNPFTDFGAETKGLIGQGLADVNAMRNGPLGTVASGGWLGGNANPYFEKDLATTRANTINSIGDEFNSFGRWSGGSMIDTASRALADSENAARSANFENEYNRFLGANQTLQGANATGLGYSGLLDSKAAEKTAADSAMWDRNNNANFNHIAQYLGLLNGSGGAEAPTNKPVSFWDILGGIGSTIGSFL